MPRASISLAKHSLYNGAHIIQCIRTMPGYAVVTFRQVALFIHGSLSQLSSNWKHKCMQNVHAHVCVECMYTCVCTYSVYTIMYVCTRVHVCGIFTHIIKQARQATCDSPAAIFAGEAPATALHVNHSRLLATDGQTVSE